MLTKMGKCGNCPTSAGSLPDTLPDTGVVKSESLYASDGRQFRGRSLDFRYPSCLRAHSIIIGGGEWEERTEMGAANLLLEVVHSVRKLNW